jgi:hypothetical protein
MSCLFVYDMLGGAEDMRSNNRIPRTQFFLFVLVLLLCSLKVYEYWKFAVDLQEISKAARLPCSICGLTFNLIIS